MRAGIQFTHRCLRDATIAGGSLWLALLLRFDGTPPDRLNARLVWLGPAVATILVVALVARGMYQTVPAYASIRELIRLAEAVGMTSVLLLALVRFAREDEYLLPLSVPILWGLITFVAIGASRLAYRLSAYLSARGGPHAAADRVLILGAGDAGEMIARDMLRNPKSKLVPVGFLDDDPAKHRRAIHGLPVLGSITRVEELAARARADLVVLAMPSVGSGIVRNILQRLATAGLRAKILPSLRELMGNGITSADIRDVDIADLIGRDPVKINVGEVAGYLEGRTVLVTGAAGSIGSELARQVLRFGPAKLLLLDNNETDLFWLHEDLSPNRFASGSDRVVSLVADIREVHRIDRIFSEWRPDVVFHAAAFKHVPVMEQCPGEAVRTNVIGTRNVAMAAMRHGAGRFVLVSTDKAVNPVCVMGATKRVAEMLIECLNEAAETVLACVRFGNVVGSRGSVVPIFARQIQAGGPITVTHPDAARYFMTVEEAASLIIQSAAFARGGDTFVLDMGEPVRILDLAERMRDLLAAGNKDRIEITYVGLRPGEKLQEDLWNHGEDLDPSAHPRISRTRPAAGLDPDTFRDELLALEVLAAGQAPESEIRERVFSLVKRDDLVVEQGRIQV